MPKKLVLREKIYIPIKDEDELERVTPKLNKRFKVCVFDDKNCEKCDLIGGLDQRPVSDCYECQNMKGEYRMWNSTVKKGTIYVGLPWGKRSLVKRVFPIVEELDFLDKTPDIDFKSKLKFTGELRDHQAPAVKSLMKKADRGFLRGTLLCPPRTGKTVMSIALACMMRKRTLILTNQHDLCKQFYDTCYGSDNQPALTNAGSLKTPAVIMAKTIDDFYKGDIVIATYQQFISDIGKEKLKKIDSLFSLLVIDEVHRAAAKTFLQVVANLNTKHKLGLTGTFGRKDGLDELTAYVLGAPIHSVQIDTLVPTCIFHETGLHSSKDYSMWTYYLRWLERSSERKDMIIKQVIKDLKDGHSIVIPCYHTSLIHELVRRINWEWGSKIAAAVVGGSSKSDRAERDAILEKAKEGKIRCVVGTRKIVSTGINVPRWSHLYWIDPLSNPPNWIQEYSRILTPLPGKKPVIRFFLDDSGQTIGCLRSCLFKTEGDTKSLASKAIITADQWAIANKYLKKKKGQRVQVGDDDGDRRSFLTRKKK